MMRSRRRRCLALVGAFALTGCQSNDTRSAAVLAAADEASLAQLRTVLAQAMDRASVELGPGDLTETSTISVLPRRLSAHEDRSPAMPTQFDLVIEGSRCLVVRRDTGDAFHVPGLACRARER